MNGSGAAPPVERPGSAVILMYHRVRLEGARAVEGDYALPPELFARQLRRLASSGPPVAPLEAVSSGLPTGRSVILTFDDGYDTDEEVALPLLQELGLPAAFFVNPALVGGPGRLDWSGVRRLANAGMHVGSHGLDHTLLGDVPERELDRQLSESRQRLEDRLGREVHTLALPGGSGGRRVARRAAELGYRLVLGSRPGRLCGVSPGRALPRFAIRRGHEAEWVERLAHQAAGPLVSARLRHLLKQALRRGLGSSTYQRLRERLVPTPGAGRPPGGEERR